MSEFEVPPGAAGQPPVKEWQGLKGVEYRYPNQFGEALLVPGVNCSIEEAQALIDRGAVFPLETAQPAPSVMVFEREPHI